MKMGKKLLAAVVLALPLSMTACGGTTSRTEYTEMFVDTLIRDLRSDHAHARFCAARALGNLRCDAVQKAVPPLRCLLYDMDHDVRRQAERTLRKIEPCVIEIGRNETSGSPL